MNGNVIGKISLIKYKINIMDAIQFLLNAENASEYEDIREETSIRWDTIAGIMEDYHKYKLNLPKVL